jgi:hypothetical protein
MFIQHVVSNRSSGSGFGSAVRNANVKTTAMLVVLARNILAVSRCALARMKGMLRLRHLGLASFAID